MAVTLQLQARFLRHLRHRTCTLSMVSASFPSGIGLDVPISRDFTHSKIYTLTNLIKACGDQMDLAQGKKLHADAREEGLASSAFVASAIVCMYGKCGGILEAENAFGAVSQPDVILCNAMLAAYVKLEHGENTLSLFRQMNAEGIAADLLTYVSVLQACGFLAQRGKSRSVGGHSIRQRYLEIGRALHAEARRKGFTADARINTALVDSIKDASLEIGRALHAVARKKGLVGSVYLGTTLVNVYGKCDSLSDAEEAFSSMGRRTVVSWNAMLSVYIELGHSDKALLLFRQLQKEGVTPDQQSFVSALHACGNLMKRERALGRSEASLTPIAELGRCLHAAVRNAIGFVL